MLTIWLFQQGNIYAQIIERIIDAARNDFEEAAVDGKVLTELKEVSLDHSLYCLLSLDGVTSSFLPSHFTI